MLTGLMNRIRAWLTPRTEPKVPPPPPVPPSPVGNFREARRLQPITVPTQGEVFSFQVYLMVIWRGEGITREQLQELAGGYEQRIRQRLRHEITDMSRRYPPHRAFELEQALNSQFSQSRSLGEGVMVRWEAKVRVLPEERVREKLRPFWERRIEMDSEHALGIRRAELVDELTTRWSQVLERLYRQPFTVEGAKLTEDAFATIMKDLKEEERNLLSQLQGLLEKASARHNTLGLYEFAETYDKLINDYRQRYEMLSSPSAGGGPGTDNGSPS